MWNVRDFEVVEKPRKEFTGEPKAGVYATGGYFVPFENVGDESELIEKFFPVWKRFVRQLIGAPIIM